jgi:hypothetical protein
MSRLKASDVRCSNEGTERAVVSELLGDDVPDRQPVTVGRHQAQGAVLALDQDAGQFRASWVVYEADGTSGMLVEDRQAVSERYARSPVRYRKWLAVGVPCSRYYGRRERLVSPRDCVCTFCMNKGSLFSPAAWVNM